MPESCLIRCGKASLSAALPLDSLRQVPVLRGRLEALLQGFGLLGMLLLLRLELPGQRLCKAGVNCCSLAARVVWRSLVGASATMDVHKACGVWGSDGILLPCKMAIVEAAL